MRIDVPVPDAWGRLSELYRAALPLKEPALNVQIYGGLAHAVGEITSALARLYTHKKTIAIVSGVDPTFDRVAVAFSQEQFNVRMVSVADAARTETWAPLMDELLFALTSDDDPVTGRLYPFEAGPFAGKRVFRLHVSHEAHRHAPLARPEPFVARILSLTPSRALMVAGERLKIEPQVAPSLHWADPHSGGLPSPEEIARELAPAGPSGGVAAAQAAIQEFEANLPAGFRAYFSVNDARLFDRAVIYHPDFDGSAIIDELAQTLQTKIAPPGERASLETTSACRWESPRFNDWLLARGESDATTRGLVIIAANLVTPALRTHLETAAAKVARLQGG